MTRTYIIQNDELQHYGRKGMKWYQSVFGKDKAYTMSINKLKRLDNKLHKRSEKSAKYMVKSVVNQEKSNRSLIKGFKKRREAKYLKYKRKSVKQLYKASKEAGKAKKWANSMNEFFGDIKLSSVSAEDIAVGRKYSIKAIEDYLKNN